MTDRKRSCPAVSHSYGVRVDDPGKKKGGYLEIYLELDAFTAGAGTNFDNLGRELNTDCLR